MRVSLSPFAGCVGVVVPMPPVDALIYCVNYRRCMDFGVATDHDGKPFVPFTVFVDMGLDVSDADGQQAAVQYFCEHKDEVLARGAQAGNNADVRKLGGLMQIDWNEVESLIRTEGDAEALRAKLLEMITPKEPPLLFMAGDRMFFATLAGLLEKGVCGGVIPALNTLPVHVQSCTRDSVTVTIFFNRNK